MLNVSNDPKWPTGAEGGRKFIRGVWFVVCGIHCVDVLCVVCYVWRVMCGMGHCVSES